ncbi:MAG: hypothetical protein PSV13_01155 [Lacunisphaera sp.]|nr:hypothetical protein [Lacunisphaera sp.]
MADEAALDHLGREAKQWTCPHCRRAGTLNAHGALRGGAEHGPGKDARRGRRFFCSDRGRRPGCGRTFSVFLAQVFAGASVRTAAWWRFCRGRLAGLGVLAAWEAARSGFSLESAYRWWRGWRRAEPALRSRWWRGREPPEGLGAVIERTYGADDPLAAFQVREQRAWPGFAS